MGNLMSPLKKSRSVRTRIRFEVEIRGSRQSFFAEAVDLSVEGLCFSSPILLVAGERVGATLHSPDGLKHSLSLEVRWTRPEPGPRSPIAAEVVHRILEATSTHVRPPIKAPPSFILLDLGLPGKSGLDVLQWMRATAPFTELPVFVLSANRKPDLIMRALDLNIRSYFQKPDVLSELQPIVHGMLAHWFRRSQGPLGPKDGG